MGHAYKHFHNKKERREGKAKIRALHKEGKTNNEIAVLMGNGFTPSMVSYHLHHGMTRKKKSSRRRAIRRSSRLAPTLTSTQDRTDALGISAILMSHILGTPVTPEQMKKFNDLMEVIKFNG